MDVVFFDKLNCLTSLHVFEMKWAVKAQIKEMGICYRMVGRPHNHALRHLAEAYAILKGIKPHNNPMLNAVRRKGK